MNRQRIGNPIGRALRGVVVLAAVALLTWSFYWVASRPFRTKKLSGNQIVLTVIHWGEKVEDQIMDELVRDFESRPENADIRIRRMNLGQAAAVNTKLQTMFAGGEPPDVFYLGYEKVADFASKRLLADMDELIAQDQAAGRPTIDLGDFFPSLLNCFRYDVEAGQIGQGKLIGLPKDFTTIGFYYNKDLFRRAGIPEPPKGDWTWDEFIAAARAIGKLPGCYGADFATWEPMVRVYLWTHGVRMVSADWREFYVEDPQLIAALEELQGWFHDEQRTLVSAKTQLETVQEPFLAGNVGMAGPFGRWKAPIYRLIEDFEWDFAPFPHAAGRPPANGLFTAGWAMSANGRYKPQAWRFVKYMQSQRGQELMCKAGLAIPTFKSVAHSPAFIDPSQKPENVQSLLDAAEYAEPIIWPADPKYLHQLRIRLEEVFKLNKPVAEAMSKVRQDWQQNRSFAKHPPMPWRTIAWFILVPLSGTVAVTLWLWWRRRPRGLAFQEELAGNLMIGPWVVGFAIFTAFPIVLSLLLAFTRWSGLTTLGFAEWVGLDNLWALFTKDSTFRQSLKVTGLYVLLAVPSGQIAALLAAMLMNHEFKAIGSFRAIWYLPSVLAGVGMAVMWRWVFHHEYGLLKVLIDPMLPAGMSTPAWLEQDAADWGVPAFAIVNLWSIGGTMMIYLAGLKGIPKDLYEAAEIDGAVGWRKFTSVTVPMLSPVIFFNVIIAVIASFQVFTQAYIMTGGGPGDATRFYVVYLYNVAFDFHDMGYASVMAWLLLVIVLVLTLALMAVSRKFVHYEGLKA